MAVGYTIISTRRDRRDNQGRAEDERADADRRLQQQREDADRRADRDRADAEERLRRERELSEQRLREERETEAESRRRDRQRENAVALIRRVSELQPRIVSICGLALRERAGISPFPGRTDPYAIQRNQETRAVIEALRHGAWTELGLLGFGEAAQKAAERYRVLVRLVDEAALTEQVTDRDVDTLLNYATWVRITLRVFAEDETIPPIYGGSPERPQLGLVDDMPSWTPHPLPPEWEDETAVNAPLRRSTKPGAEHASRGEPADPGGNDPSRS